jgi:hypothetical protein
MAEPSRRFPSPWRADRMPGGYVVRDANGQALAYLYSCDNEHEARQAKVLTKDEARRIAINMARLPESETDNGRGRRAFPRRKSDVFYARGMRRGRAGAARLVRKGERFA